MPFNTMTLRSMACGDSDVVQPRVDGPHAVRPIQMQRSQLAGIIELVRQVNVLWTLKHMHHSSTIDGRHVGQSVGCDFPDEGRTATGRAWAKRSKSCADRLGECGMDGSLRRRHTATHNVYHGTPPGCHPDRQVVSPQSSRR
eukprot:6213239-Pleurochrysis_carterae.AAC.2